MPSTESKDCFYIRPNNNIMNKSTSGRSDGTKQEQHQQPPLPSCFLCYSVDMMDLFSKPSDLEYDDDVVAATRTNDRCTKNNYYFYSVTNHCLVESKDSDDYDDDDDLSVPSRPHNAEMGMEWTHDTSSVARKVCKLWRKRRRQEKEKTMLLLRQQQQHQQEAEPIVTVMSRSESSPVTIKSSVSLKMLHPINEPYDEVEDDLNKKNIAIIVGKGKKTRHHA
jgi:hypothetical protein